MAAISRNSLYSSSIRFGLSGSFPEMVSPVQSTKAAGGFIALTSAKILPGVGGCLQLFFAGRLSPAMTKVNLLLSVGLDSSPVLGSGERDGIWPKAPTVSSCKNIDLKKSWMIGLARFTEAPFTFKPELRNYMASIFKAFATTSIYFRPEPVLNRTTLSVGLRNFCSREILQAARQAAPSGAAKTPSLLAHSCTACMI